MSTRIRIVVQARCERLHFWRDAPDEVLFLKTPHRHEFHVKLSIQVEHDNRDLEFILVKRWLQKFLEPWSRQCQRGEATESSCEQMALEILQAAHQKYRFRAAVCEVFEDGENGAEVKWIAD